MTEADISTTELHDSESATSIETDTPSFPREITAMENAWQLLAPLYAQFVSLQDGGNGIALPREQVEQVLGVQGLRDMVAVEELAREPKDEGDGWNRKVTKEDSRLVMQVTPQTSSPYEDIGDVMVRYEGISGGEFIQFGSSIAEAQARTVECKLIGEKDYRLKIVRQVGDKEILVDGSSFTNEGRQTMLKITEATTRVIPPAQS